MAAITAIIFIAAMF